MQARERLEEEHCSWPVTGGEGEDVEEGYEHDNGERDPRTQYHQQRSETEQRREGAGHGGHNDEYTAICDRGPQTMTSIRTSDTDG